MARAGQQVLREAGRLEDRISVGVLARAFPRQAVEEAIDAAGAREQRTRMLPAWLTVYFVLALALFMDMGAGRVMRRLAGTPARAARGITVAVPSEEALSNARSRVGSGPLRLLFEGTAGLVEGPGTPGAFWRGLHLVVAGRLDAGCAGHRGQLGALRRAVHQGRLGEAAARGVPAGPAAGTGRVRHPGPGRRRDRRLQHRGEDAHCRASAAPGTGDAGAGRP